MLDLPLKPPLDLVWRGLSDARCAAAWHSALQSRCVCGIGLYWALNTSTVPVHWALNMLCLCNTAMPNLALSASCLACRGRPTIPVRRMLRAHTKLSWQVCAGAHVHERLVRVAGGSGAAPGMRAARCARTRAPRAWPTECVPSIRL